MNNKNYTKVNLTSSNLSQERLDELRRILPDAFSENKIDWDKLRAVLGDEIDGRIEKFSFTWAGKSNAIKNVLIPSKATLLPAKDESVKFDTSENLFIEGDNLEVLKLLQKAYFEQVKMIYIDPPYNTGGDFVYHDDFATPLKNYLQQTGQKNGDGASLTTNKETNGRFHSDWLSMMYPRLKLAWNLLRDDGVIFVSIDDNEVHHLRMILDEIFGEENFRNQIIVRRRVKSLNVQFADEGLNTMNVGSEYVLVYAKSDSFMFRALRMTKEVLPTKGSWNVFWSGADRPTMRYELLGFTPSSGQWRWSKVKAEEGIKNYNHYLEKYSGKIILEQYWIDTGEKLKFVRRIADGKGKNGGVQYWIPPSDTSLRTSDWTDIEASEIHKEFDLPFDNPKSTKLIKTLIDTVEDKDFIVLDFFAGSGTTAQSAMELNVEDGGSRKWICVQLPERTAEDSQAFSAGYKSIADITKERIRLAVKKLSDVGGFKIFKLGESNYPENQFDFDPAKSEEENKKAFADYLSKAKQAKLFDDTKAVDVVYENIVKEGLSLNSKVAEQKIGKNTAYTVTDGERQILVSLDKRIDEKTISELTSKDFKGKTFICLDNALDDTAKANLGLNVELKTI